MLYLLVDLKIRILSRRTLNTKTLTTYMKNLVRLVHRTLFMLTHIVTHIKTRSSQTMMDRPLVFLLSQK